MPDLGTRWGAPALALLLTALLLLAASGAPSSGTPAESRHILEVGEGALDRVEALVTGGGGTVRARLDGLSSLVVDASPALVARLRTAPEVVRATPDGQVELHTYDPQSDAGSPRVIAKDVVKAGDLWSAGIYGEGVDVALIDSGVVPVTGLDGAGKVVHGPDLSFESQDPETRHLDTYGHGTHLAGLIAGQDVGSPLKGLTDGMDDGRFAGIAPGARLISVKVADNAGATDVSQVIAAIDWVIQHRTSGDLDIRVLNLAFGTTSTQPYVIDPLAHAVEAAWRRGIVVVVAAGNRGAAATSLDDPAYSPHVIAVGATGPVDGGTSRGDHRLAPYSSCGDGVRDPDVLAPGTSLVSLRSPGSRADVEHGSSGYVTERFFRGTGTSQATAVVSGGAALLLSARPQLTPDQVKQALVASAEPVDGEPRCTGAGLIDLNQANDLAASLAPGPIAMAPFSTGLGSLEAARGGLHLVDRVCTGELETDDDELECEGSWVDVELSGEQDIFGAAWSGSRWSADLWSGSTWSGGDWNGSRWSGSTWSGSRWSAAEWTGSRWSGSRWSDLQWSGSRWSGSRWSGSRWSATFWTTGGWSTTGWSTSDWR